MQDKTDEIASTHLGKRVSGSEVYNSDLLVAVPRCENRARYAINEENLPFEGWDVWHAYEFSALTENGLPVTRLLKLKYGCESRFIVESKSLKLYLNSFNMTRIGKTQRECLKISKGRIESDLSKKLQTRVEVEFLENNAGRTAIFSDFKNLLTFVDEDRLKIENFKEAPEVLRWDTGAQSGAGEKCDGQKNCDAGDLRDVGYDGAKSDAGENGDVGGEAREYFLTFDSLRSNCRVTHQPDFGDVFIYYKSKKHIDEASLLKYLCSFRSEYHFHEECCEMIYKRLFDLLGAGAELMVCALYTRRGGIDICPLRYSENCSFRGFEALLDLKILARNGVKQ